MSVNQLNYNGEIKFYDDYLAKSKDVPLNASADGNGGLFDNISKTNASIEVVAKVVEDISIADTKAITVKLQHSDDKTVFTDLQTLYTKIVDNAAGETIPAGTELARFIPPTTSKKWIKAVLTTTDAAAEGKIDIYLNYIPR